MDGIFWILGCPDAEMSAIESLLRQCGQVVFMATAGGKRVRPGQIADGAVELLPDGSEGAVLRDPTCLDGLIPVEVPGPIGATSILSIDHHDDHPLASAPPEEFLRASSIGQVISRLAVMEVLPDSWGGDFLESIGARGAPSGQLIMSPGGWSVVSNDCFRIIPPALVMEAAADHCPAAAIAGRCPGVDPGALAPFLAESKRRQYFPAMSPEDFARELETSRATLRIAPPVTEFCDPHPAGFSPDLEEVYIVGADSEDCPIGSWVAPGSEDDGDGGMGLAVTEWLYICRHEPDGTPVGVVATPPMLAMRDLRHLEPGTVPAQGSGEMYPAEFLVGIVAALFEGVGFVCRIRRADGKLALRSNGHGQGTLAGTRPAEVFLADPSAFGCGPRFPAGQDASYGSPVRGFFGGLLTNQD